MMSYLWSLVSVDDSKSAHVSAIVLFYYFQFYLYTMNDTERTMIYVAEGKNYYEVVDSSVALLSNSNKLIINRLVSCV